VTVTMPALDVSVRQADLLGALRYVAVAIPKRAPVAVLAGVKLEADGTTVRLSGFDYEFAATVDVPGTGEGSALVNCADLTAAVKTFPKAATVHLAVDNDKVRVGCNGVELTLPALALVDYPALPPACEEGFAILDAAAVAMLPDVVLAAGKDDILPILTGVHAAVADGTLTLAAADRYRLHVQEFTYTSNRDYAGAPVLIPAAALTAVSRHFKGGCTMLVDRASSGAAPLAMFADGSRTLTVRLLEGEYPKYRSLIPAEPFAYEATFDAAAMTAAVGMVAATAPRNLPARLQLAEHGVVVEWISEGDGARMTVPAELNGEALTIAFSPKYLLDGLKAAGGTVRLMGTTPTKPAILRRDDRPGFTALVMPVRLAD
jgi:DNA polymerase-3 subunit beta